MKRWIPAIFLIALMVIAYLTEVHEIVSFETLKEKREELLHFVQKAPLVSAICYTAFYAVSVALSLPVGLVLSLLGGFLFAQPYSTLLVLVGATLGATLLFLIAKTALGGGLKKSAQPFLQKFKEGFDKDAANYLLFLRLIPIFPFWLVNLAPAFLGVPFWTYVWTTFVGIIPGAFVFTQAGVGLGAILDKGEELTLNAIFNTQVKIALIALAIFVMLPVIYKRVRARKE